MKNVLIFVAGAATGAFVTYKFVAKYYKDESDKEIQSVIDTFNERKNNLREEIKKENEMKVEKENKTILLKIKRKRQNKPFHFRVKNIAYYRKKEMLLL